MKNKTKSDGKACEPKKLLLWEYELNVDVRGMVRILVRDSRDVVGNRNNI